MNEKTIFIVRAVFFMDCFDSDDFVRGWESDGRVGVRADCFGYEYIAKEGYESRKKKKRDTHTKANRDIC